MKLYFKKSFIKQYAKLKKPDQVKIDQALELFVDNPYHPQLHNHALVGKLTGKRAVSAGFDLRIIFESKKDYITVTMLAVGTHNQIY